MIEQNVDYTDVTDHTDQNLCGATKAQKTNTEKLSVHKLLLVRLADPKPIPAGCTLS